MAMTVTNSGTAASATLVAVLGLRMYFRTLGETAWHDFGHVRSPAREQDLTELEIKSARLGRLATVKKITTEVSLEYTFESISVLDAATVALHSGGAAGEGLIGTGGFFAVEEFLGTEGQVMLVQPNAETGEMAKLAFYPLVLLKGDGEESGDGESESSLTFRATILPAEDYTVPAAIVVSEPSAPYGFRYFVPAASLDDALDAISDAADPVAEVGEGEGEGEGE
jgi:hypothetical protein